MANITTLNTTVIDPGDLAYVPWQIWAVLFFLTFLFFFHSIIAKKNTDITSVLTAVLAAVTAYISGYIEFSTVETVILADNTSQVVPVSYIVHPTWLAYIMLGIFLISLVIVWKNIYEIYFTGEKQYKLKGFR